MAKIIDVQCLSKGFQLKSCQLSVPLEEEKYIILELCDICQFCDGYEDKPDAWSEEDFTRKYASLSKEEILAASVVSLKTISSRLSQIVACVGCRRSCERLFNELKNAGGLSFEPLIITNAGNLTVHANTSSQCEVLNNIFSTHKMPLTEIVDNIPKFRKSNRCVLHSIDGVRYRAGSHIWFEVWEGLSPKCRDALSVISCDKLFASLDVYLLKHRFCHECKNKVHRAYDILVGNRKIDAAKEKGYSSPLFTGITKCSKGHLHVKSETDFIMRLMTRAEPELQGRRERHAKTLEIAQEEVLNCIGLFLYERLQKVYSGMKEEIQAFHILFHVGLDAIKRSFEVAFEEKQGFSKFEKLCEELQKQEIVQKAKKEKRKKKKKKNEETKIRKLVNNDLLQCSDSEMTSSTPPEAPLQLIEPQDSSKYIDGNRYEDFVSSDDSSGDSWQVVGRPAAGRKTSPYRPCRVHSHSKDVFVSNTDVNSNHTCHVRSSELLKGSVSIDSLASRCSQCSRDGGYCSALCSNSSSCDSSDVACGDAFCAHNDDLDILSEESIRPTSEHGEIGGREPTCDKGCDLPLQQYSTKQCLSLQQMLNDFSCDTDEIPEAEVKAWHARLGSVKQMRAELRQKLRQQFHQLCHKKV